jgi:hypothetical protein
MNDVPEPVTVLVLFVIDIVPGEGVLSVPSNVKLNAEFPKSIIVLSEFSPIKICSLIRAIDAVSEYVPDLINIDCSLAFTAAPTVR